MRHDRYIQISIEASRNSTAIQQKMAAIVVKSGRVLSVAVNHKLNHAETRALKPFVTDMIGATIYIGRWNGRCSRPCDACFKAIRKAGISRIVFVDWSKNIVEERVYQ